MATLQQNLVWDATTLTSYLIHINGISSAFSTFGWVQSTDTGQMMLTGMNISAVLRRTCGGTRS